MSKVVDGPSENNYQIKKNSLRPSQSKKDKNHQRSIKNVMSKKLGSHDSSIVSNKLAQI